MEATALAYTTPLKVPVRVTAYYWKYWTIPDKYINVFVQLTQVGLFIIAETLEYERVSV